MAVPFCTRSLSAAASAAIVNETISDAMQYTVDSISVFLFVGFISSLFIGRRKHAL
jgi:hypothetical protein